MSGGDLVVILGIVAAAIGSLYLPRFRRHANCAAGRHRWAIPPGDYNLAVPSYRRVCLDCGARKQVGGPGDALPERHPQAEVPGDAVLLRVFVGDPYAPEWEQRFHE